jgi:hypothetical protein
VCGDQTFERDRDGQWWRIRRVVDPDVRAAVVTGGALITIGYVLSVANAFAARSNDDRFIGLIPIGGPIATVWRDGAQLSPWATASLIISSWMQASGLVLMALMAAAPLHKQLRERVTVGGGPGQAGFSLAVKF